MSTCKANENTIVFTPLGVMHCGRLLRSKYNMIVVNRFEYNNKKILDNICSQISDLYSHGLIDAEKLVLRLNYQDSSKIKELNKLFELLKEKGYKQIEFVNKNLQYNPIIENMLKEKKAALCLKMDYGEKSHNNVSLNNLLRYLKMAKYKENINVHCVIRDVNSANNKGIQDFIKLMYKSGINTIGLRIDKKFLETNTENNTVPENLNGLFINFFKTARKYCFFIDVKSKEQNEFLRKLCKKNKIKKESLKNKIKRFILRREDNNEI